ncbi:GNAT family N-acetyltransferase [Paenibacillus sp. JX-17]|uniref:GNAT family N-acetyltransferase n=1 Tax=Paenibacillus lacisoli TaxID=3064525 RepID=A0ABT9CHG0_9BACL|nr:GNAT family N-acetyltransferase [Paenibacillus sp. JX-17]MDO7908641.1 GNAT family N-acetyltransferase [Paenibacillus sp. JX-17]
MVLRSAKEMDEATLLKLYSECTPDLQHVPFPDELKVQLVQQQFLAERHFVQTHYPDADVGVIFDEGQPIGRLNVHRGPNGYRVLAIALCPAYRNRGIGTKLLGDILQEAKDNYKAVRLQAAWHNVSARRWYENLGFKIVEDKGVCYEMEWTP